MRNLVENAAAEPDEVGVDLPCEAKYRRRAGVGGREARRGIEKPRAGDDQADSDPPGRSGVSVGHVGSRLLVASMNGLDGIAFFVESVECPVELHPGQAEDDVDSLSQQRLYQRLSSGHGRHVCLPGSIEQFPRVCRSHYTQPTGSQQGIGMSMEK